MNQAIKILILFLVMLFLSVILIYKGIEPSLQSPVSFESPEILPAATSNVRSLPPEATATGSAIPEQSEETDGLYPVTRVIDGDTISVKWGNEEKTIRLIGINTPETVDPRRPVQCFGSEASDATKELLNGKEIRLEKDVSDTDRYGRMLRFVYLPLVDGSLLFVNDYLVREGYAYASTYPPDVAMSARFKEAENQAREAGKGLWGKCPS